MANLTDDGVWSLIPDDNCVDPASATLEGAQNFNINDWSNYVNSLMVDLVPGIVLGSLACLGFILFCVWIAIRAVRRHKIKAAKDAKAALQAQEASQAQFMSSAGAPPLTAEQWKANRQRMTSGRVLRWSILVFGLAVVGVAAWGLGQSIISSNYVISNFWIIVRSVEDLVIDIQASLTRLAGDLAILSQSIENVQGVLQSLVDLASRLPIVGGLIPTATVEKFLGDNAGIAINGTMAASKAINESLLPVIQDDVIPTLDSVLSNESWSMSIETTWRYVVIAVLFGLLILFTIVTAGAVYGMRYGVLATICVALYWLLATIILVLGLGVFNGARSVANDSCLYSEELILRSLNESLTGDTRDRVLSTVQYYLGQTELKDPRTGKEILFNNATYDCNLTVSAGLLHKLIQIDLFTVVDYADALDEFLPTISDAISLVPLVPSSIKQPLVDTADQLDRTLEEVCNLTALLVREQRVWPIYVAAKTYICCQVTNSIYKVWVPWTVAGVLALVFGLLASIRVIVDTVRPAGHHTALIGTSSADGVGDGAAAGWQQPPPAAMAVGQQEVQLAQMPPAHA